MAEEQGQEGPVQVVAVVAPEGLAVEQPPQGPAEWRRVHLWHIQPVRDLLLLAVILGVLYLGYVLRAVTEPMLLALFLAYLFEPLVKRLTRIRRISRPMAVGGILAAFIAAILVPLIIGGAVAVVQSARLASNVVHNSSILITSLKSEDPAERQAAFRALPTSWRWISQRMVRLRSEVDDYRKHRESLDPADGTPAPPPTDAPPPASNPTGTPVDPQAAPPDPVEHVPPPPKWKQDWYGFLDAGMVWIATNGEELVRSLGERILSSGTGAALAALAAVVAVARVGLLIFLTCVFFFFFSTGWGRVLRFSSEFIPRDKRGRVFDLLGKMDRVIAGFVRGRLLICGILALVLTFAYWLIGVPMPIVIGLILGASFIIPYVHVLGVPVAMVLLWLNPSWGPLAALTGGISPDGAAWWWIVFAPLGVYLLAQFLDDWVLSPTIAGKATDMDTPTILFASLAGGVLAGLYGVLLAIPVAACIKILAKEVIWPKIREWMAGRAPDPLPISTGPAGEPPAAPNSA